MQILESEVKDSDVLGGCFKQIFQTNWIRLWEKWVESNNFAVS